MSFTNGDTAHSIAYSAFYSVQASDWGVLSPPSGTQPVMPLAIGDTGYTYVMTNSRFKTQWKVDYVRPSDVADPVGVTLANVQCIAPVWGAGVTTTNAFGAAPADTSFIVLNGCLFTASAGTTGATAPAVFNFARLATTLDGTTTWTSQGNRGLLKLTFVNSSGGSAAPALQNMDFFQS
jgi:hypothetical protein